MARPAVLVPFPSWEDHLYISTELAHVGLPMPKGGRVDSEDGIFNLLCGVLFNTYIHAC